MSRKNDKGLPAVWQRAQEEGEGGLRQVVERVAQQVLLVVGISAGGYREVLGAWPADSENESSWAEVFRELKARGLEGVIEVA